MGKEILDITNVIGDAFKGLQQTLTKKQKKEMTNKKYTYMNKDQLNHLYGENGTLSVFLFKFIRLLKESTIIR